MWLDTGRTWVCDKSGMVWQRGRKGWENDEGLWSGEGRVKGG